MTCFSRRDVVSLRGALGRPVCGKFVKEVYTLADLQDWDHVQRDADCPIRLGVLGDPVAHSLSPQMQNAALRQCKIDMQYARFQISTDDLGETLKQVRGLDFVGINLTVPHKINALLLIDDVDPDAKRIGAVNIIKIEKGNLLGFNTDGRGFSRAI